MEERENRRGGLIGPTHHAGFATIPSSFLRVGSALRKGSPCQWDRCQITGETNCCIVRVTSKNILDKYEHFLREDGASFTQDMLATAAEHDDVAVSDCEKYLRVKSIRGAKELVTFTKQICVQ